MPFFAPQQEQDNRRTSFSFLKYSPDRRSTTSMRRTREHSKKIALQLTPTQPQRPSEEEAGDFANFDAFSPPTTPTTTEDARSSVASRSHISTAHNTTTSRNIRDGGRMVSRRRKSSLDAFVDQQHQHSSPQTPLRQRTSVASTTTTSSSMPTLPSNSSMQSRNVMLPSPRGAAARRRMRRQGSGTTIGSDGDSSFRQPSRNHGVDNHTARHGIPSAPPLSRTNSSASTNLFDDPNGFTFDAFGLDETQVDQEVNAAIQDLAGSHPGLFDAMDMASDEEFPPVSFDSPAGSRENSPSIVEEDGFHNVTASFAGLPLHVRHSSTSSDRSSLTSSNEHPHEAAGGGINMFKVQAGFHTSSRPPRTPSPNWASFHERMPVLSPPLTAKSEPGVGRRPKFTGTRLTSESLEHRDEPFRSVTSETGAPPSSVGAPSEVAVASDMGVASDVVLEASSEAGVVVPLEIVSSSKKSKSSGFLSVDTRSTEITGGDSLEERERPQSVNNLKEAWEQREFEEMDKKEQRRSERQRARSPLDHTDIERLQTQLGEEILTPAAVEERWPYAGPRFPATKKLEQPQEQPVEEDGNQQTSFMSQRERLKPVAASSKERAISSSQSDFVGYRSSASLEMQSVLKRLERDTSDAKSDVGETPYLARVNHSDAKGQRRRYNGSQRSSPSNYSDEWNDDQAQEWNAIASDRHSDQTSSEESDAFKPSHPKLSYRERRELELRNQKEDERRTAEVRRDVSLPKKMTYRERRELELQKEAEQTRQRPEEREKEPERDVASLIRRRIAANKKYSSRSDSAFANESDNVASVQSELKKVVIDKSPDYSDMITIRGVAAKSSMSPSDSESSTTRQDRRGIDDSVRRGLSEPSDSPVIPSMVLSEVDSSSTARTLPEIPTSHDTAPTGQGSSVSIDEKKQYSARAVDVAAVAAPSTKSMLNALFASRVGAAAPPEPQQERNVEAQPSSSATPGSPSKTADDRPALKDDPKYDRYFRMLKVGMPTEVVKHAMTRDGVDPSVLDGDHNKPAGQGGVPLKEDPKYTKYFKMLKMGLPMGAVKNAMERDGVNPSIMDGDHNEPAGAGMSNEQKDKREDDKPKDTHRRTRLHWETLRKVRSNSLWAKLDNDPEVDEIDIDEEEFAELFQAELTPVQVGFGRAGGALKKRGAAVRVIEAKRANNGGIILARLKMTHDDMADAVDRIDGNGMTSEQMQNIIEYLPTKEERSALEAYMLEGGQDAAQKFDGLCECEKFMVSMMTVKHAKRKVRALLFRLQFEGFLESLQKDTDIVETSCEQLSNSVRLRKLLGIVLNLGNKLNTIGTHSKRKAGAFSLNSLLKLSHAKAFDKKTTFLDYVVLVVQRNNEILLRFKDDIPTALKADKIYWDQCLGDLEELENQLENVRRIALYQARLQQMYRLKKKKARSEMDEDSESLGDMTMSLDEEVEALRATQIGGFTLGAIKKVSSLRDKVETTKKKFARLLEYFGEEDKRDMQPHDLFNIIATFSRDFEKSKDRVFAKEKIKQREARKQKASDNAQTHRTPTSKDRLPRQPHPSKSAPPKFTSQLHDGQQKGTTVKLRSSNLQPNMSSVLRDVTSKKASPRWEHGYSPSNVPRYGQNVPSPVNRPGRVNAQVVQSAQSAASTPNASQSPSMSRSAASQSPRAPGSDSSPKNGVKWQQQSSSMARGSNSTDSVSRSPSETSTHSRARMHRKLVQAGRSSASSLASTTQPSTLSSKPQANPSPSQKHYDTQQLSPRSSIRQRRRMEQRKPTQRNERPSDALRLEMD